LEQRERPVSMSTHMWTSSGWRKGSYEVDEDYTRHQLEGMFIYSDAKPPTKADIRVKVSFASLGRGLTNLHLRANSLVVREDPPSSPGADYGFAILNRNYELHNGVPSIED